MKKKFDYRYLYIAVITFFLIMAFTNPFELLGSRVDWVSQHTTFPDYFRNLFYQTKQLFPNFAPQIGAGENIYFLSYYGLWSPIVLFSYFLPHVPMYLYLIISNIVLAISSGLLLYYWLKKHSNRPFSAFFSTILFLLSSSFLFQFHRHFMFVNYMPFLILGLIGVDYYFDTKKRWLYLISTFLMILTSYYYSVMGIFIIAIYGISRIIKNNKNITWKEWISDLFSLILPLLIAITMASFLLLPTLSSILSGRGDKDIFYPISMLVLPKVDMRAFLYDNYALGLTSISMISVLYLIISKRRERRFLDWVFIGITIIPLVVYLFNGTLYIRYKVLIPCLPFFAYFISKFLSNLYDEKIDVKHFSIVILLFLFISVCFSNNTVIFYFDFIITILSILCYQKFHKSYLLIVPITTIAVVNFSISNISELFITKEHYEQIFSEEKEQILDNVLDREKNIVRSQILDDTFYTVNKIYNPYFYQNSIYSSTYNQDYMNFYKNIFHNTISHRNKLILSQNSNIMFETFMGVKYAISSYHPGIGYHKIKEGKTQNSNLYQNNDTLPLFYATNHVMNEKEFLKLPYPSNTEALIGQVVTSAKSNHPYPSSIHEVHLNYTTKGFQNLTVTKEKGRYKIIVPTQTTGKIYLSTPLQNQILFLQFDLENGQHCEIGDQKIMINHVRNTLTCEEWEYQNDNHTFHYVLSKEKNLKTLTITFSKGIYYIDHIHTFTLPYQSIKERVADVSPVILNKKKTKGDKIEGIVYAKDAGYIASSIPYDNGFSVFIDGKKIKYEKVNQAFLGFPITKGKHQLYITYIAPMRKVGVILSYLGFIGFCIMIHFDHKKTH